MLGALAAVGLGTSALGLFGALKQKTPKYNTGYINDALNMLQNQQKQLDDYFSNLNSLYEQNYKIEYGQGINEAANYLANNGIYESPVSENLLNKQREALAQQYAMGKSDIMGQKLNAQSAIEQQRLAYMGRLADANYQNELAKMQKRQSIIGGIAGLGFGLLKL